MNPKRAPAGRAIVTYSRSWQALAAIRSLGSRGIDVIAGDEFAFTPGALSRYATRSFRHPSSQSDPGGFLDALETVVRENAPDPGVPYVLLPIHREGHLIAKARERFEPLIRVPLARSEDIERARHKARLVELARELGLDIPRTELPRDEHELARVAREFEYPAFVKLPDGVSGVGVRCVESPEELLSEYHDLVDKYGAIGDGAPLIQAAVPGGDYCVAALFDRGEPVVSMVYESAVQYPPRKGPGVVRQTVLAPELERQTLALLRALSWHGVAEVDFRWSGRPDDRPALIEVNPRFFGGLFQAVASGVDFPWLLYQLAATGRVEAPAKVEIGVRTQTPVTGMLGILRSMLGERGTGVVERARHARAVIEQNADNERMLFDRRDPLPALGLLYPISALFTHGKLSVRVLTNARG